MLKDRIVKQIAAYDRLADLMVRNTNKDCLTEEQRTECKGKAHAYRNVANRLREILDEVETEEYLARSQA